VFNNKRGLCDDVRWRRRKGVSMNKRKIGSVTEEIAAFYLEEQGVHIVEKNFRNRYGEIDLVGYDGEFLVFFEVKYRTSRRNGCPEEAVGFQKQKQICRVADYYRCIHGICMQTPIRYDVVAIEKDTVRWYQNAFEHIY